MCPGRFPSPTPPPESSPDTPKSPFTERRESGSRIAPVHTPTRPGMVERDFTASDDFRQNPRFAQSDSALVTSVSPRLSPSVHISSSKQPAQNFRRVSEPLRRRPHENLTTPPPQKRRRVSNNTNPPLSTSSSFLADGEETSSSSPQQHDFPNSEPPESSDAYSSNEEPTNVEGHTPPSPNTEQNNDANDDERLSRSTQTSEGARDLYEKIREKLQEDVTKSSRAKGIIYIFRHPTDSTWGCKIGATTRNQLRKRIREHIAKCQFVPSVKYQSDFEFEYAFKTEKLIQCDLMDFWHSRYCQIHNGSHKEWFDVPLALAIQTVKKWESIMTAAKPYDWRWELKPVWRHILSNRRLESSDALTHDSRREQWTRILGPPTTKDYTGAYWNILIDTVRSFSRTCLQIQRFVRKNLWQVVALVFSLSNLAGFQFSNTVNLVAFTTLLCYAAYGHEPRLNVSSMKQRARRLWKARLRQARAKKTE